MRNICRKIGNFRKKTGKTVHVVLPRKTNKIEDLMMREQESSSCQKDWQNGFMERKARKERYVRWFS